VSTVGSTVDVALLAAVVDAAAPVDETAEVVDALVVDADIVEDCVKR
jgi:hypothetical protein